MTTEKVFSYFGMMPKGSNIILYGMGKRGRTFLEINEEIHWFNIVCIMDKNGDNSIDNTNFDDMNYDYILIAIADIDTCFDVKAELIDKGVDENKIIFCRTYNVKIEDKFFLGPETEYVKTAIILNGGIGDIVVSRAFINAFVRKFENIKVDIFTNKKNPARIIIGDYKFGFFMKDDLKRNEYHLVLELEHFPRIMYMDKFFIRKKNPELYNSIMQLFAYQRKKLFSEHKELNIRISTNLNRARLMRASRYDLIKANGFLDIKDTDFRISVNDEYEEEFRKLMSGKKYITFNFGADRVTVNNKVYDKPQTKQWPKEYHETINRMLKERYPDLEIIQVGAADSEKIEGADRYIFGQNLEIVKHILKNAMLHFDCEGGLVHLATNLGTKCFVVFGPTPVWFYGYEQNENIQCGDCKECQALYDDWFYECHVYPRNECMYRIYPENVFERIVEYLDERI